MQLSAPPPQRDSRQRRAPGRRTRFSRALLLPLGALALLTAAPASAQCPGTDDAFEENDDCASASAITIPFAQAQLYVEKFDPDHYVFDVAAGDELRIDVLFLDDDGDIDLYLYDAAGTCGGTTGYIARGISNSDNELVVWQNQTGAPVQLVARIEIWAGSIPVCNRYDIDITAAPPIDPCDPLLLDDFLEDNDDCATAVPAPLGLAADLWASRSDEDFYFLTLAGGATLTAQIFFIDSQTDLDLFLYDANGPCGGGFNSGELASGFTSTDDEQIVWSNTGATPRDLVIHVDVFNFNTCNEYDMRITVDGSGIGSNYCVAAPNSTGLIGLIAGSGSLLVADNDVTLHATQIPLNAFGFFLNSRDRGFVIGAGGSQGNLCLGGAVGRHNVQIQNTGNTGAFELQIDLTALPQPTGLVTVLAGESWFFQGWYRDSVGGQATSNLTNGLALPFQ